MCVVLYYIHQREEVLNMVKRRKLKLSYRMVKFLREDVYENRVYIGKEVLAGLGFLLTIGFLLVGTAFFH